MARDRAVEDALAELCDLEDQFCVLVVSDDVERGQAHLSGGIHIVVVIVSRRRLA